jgi:hypothetical protein
MQFKTITFTVLSLIAFSEYKTPITVHGALLTLFSEHIDARNPRRG